MFYFYFYNGKELFTDQLIIMIRKFQFILCNNNYLRNNTQDASLLVTGVRELLGMCQVHLVNWSSVVQFTNLRVFQWTERELDLSISYERDCELIYFNSELNEFFYVNNVHLLLFFLYNVVLMIRLTLIFIYASF